MLSVSTAYRRKVSQNSKVALKATLSFANGTTENLTGADFVMGGLEVSEATSSTGNFDIGAAIIGTGTLTLANYDSRFDDYDFTNSTATVYVGVEFDDGTTEWLRRATYNVEQPESYSSTIALSCSDNMCKFEKPFSDVRITYPATLKQIVQAVSQSCGVQMASADFPNSSYSVAVGPESDGLSCLDVISYAVQVAGCFAKCDPLGRLVVRWYDTAAFEAEEWLDGGTLSTTTVPYSDGDAADGGSFMSGGTAVNGGVFTASRYALISAISSLSVATDDVVVTGVRVTASDQKKQDGSRGADGETALSGNEGYVLEISDNPLILYGCAAAVAAQIAPAIVGMRFRPLDLSAIGDPSIEAGDPAMVIDARQRVYRSFLTQVTWKAGGYESFSCDAETPARKSATTFSALTKAVVEMRNSVKAEQTARELAVAALQEEIATSSGLYVTAVPQPDSSTIYYAHDKPTLAESQFIWKMTATAIAISTDGGATYPYGLDVSGTAILDRIYAIGIDADYITSGIITDRNGGLSSWNLDTGELVISTSAMLGNRTIQQIDDDVDEAITEAAKANAIIRTYGNGVLVCRQGNTVGALVNADGTFDVVKVTWSGTTPTVGKTLSSFGTATVIGPTDGVNVKMSSTGYKLDYGSPTGSSEELFYCGRRTASAAVEMTYGNRLSSGSVGVFSAAFGHDNIASNYYSMAFGNGCQSSSTSSVALGDHTIASHVGQVAVGGYNVSGTGEFLVGGGTSSARKTAMVVYSSGNTTIAGTLTQNSDRRLKEHVAYLGDEACDFVRNLEPAVFVKDGERKLGFYAQDVAAADMWDTTTVKAEHTDESLDFDPLTLEYTALIAPLTAYAKSLENRIAELESRLARLEEATGNNEINVHEEV